MELMVVSMAVRTMALARLTTVDPMARVTATNQTGALTHHRSPTLINPTTTTTNSTHSTTYKIHITLHTL